MVAEAELAGADVLATYDKRLTKRLQARRPVRLLSPAASLEALGIAPGADPVRRPGAGHPLENVSWWVAVLALVEYEMGAF